MMTINMMTIDNVYDDGDDDDDEYASPCYHLQQIANGIDDHDGRRLQSPEGCLCSFSMR